MIPYKKISFLIASPKMYLLGEVFVMERIERFIFSSVSKRRHHFCVLQSLILFSSKGLLNFLPCLKKVPVSFTQLMELHLFLSQCCGIRDKYRGSRLFLLRILIFSIPDPHQIIYVF
jgi:hypothetical protein